MPHITDIYLHDTKRFSDQGLQLRVPSDIVPPTQYSFLTNALPFQEGALQTRAGTSLVLNMTTFDATLANKPVHTIQRVNQPTLANVNSRLIGVGSRLFYHNVPANTISELTGVSFSGFPLPIVIFRFPFDSAAWAIISDANAMYKFKLSAANAVYWKLGITPPITQAASSDFAAGNLNSTGGSGYDWLYTYVCTATGTESNPAPEMIAAGVQRPTVNVNPDPAFGGVGFTNPANAYDGSTVTFAEGDANSANETIQSCQWNTIASPGTSPSTLFLNVDFDVTVGGSTGYVQAVIYFSIDGGTTWDTILALTTTTLARNVVSKSIPTTTLYSNVRVRAQVQGIGITDAGGDQNNADVGFTRTVSGIGGNLNLTAFHVGVNATNRTIALKVYDINMSSVAGTAATITLALVNREAQVLADIPTDPQVDAIRLYRRGGSVTAGWAKTNNGSDYIIANLAVVGGRLQLLDNTIDTSLQNFVQFNNDAPVTSVKSIEQHLPVIWGPAGNPARIFGCGDPARPEAVYFCNAGNADQWASQNWVQVSNGGDPVIGGCVFATRTFAFSRERMFELLLGVPGLATVTPYPTPCTRGLVSPYGVCVGHEIYFVAKDGIYATSGQGERSLVDNDIKIIFPTQDSAGVSVNGIDAVNTNSPQDIRLRYFNDEIYFTYRGMAGALHTLIYHIGRLRWRPADYTPDISEYHPEPEVLPPNLLLGGIDGNVYQISSADGDAGTDIAVTIRAGAFDQGAPTNQKEYGNCIIDLNPGGATLAKPVTITPRINNDLIVQASKTVTGSGRQQVPFTLSDVFGLNISFDISWLANTEIHPVLYQYDVAYRIEPSLWNHYEVRESSFGLLGYLHCRDAYICLRSTTDVTMTMTMDSVNTQTYTIPSTGNKRTKVYVPFLSNKGKMYKFTFDSSAAFQLYFQDCELRVKPWLTMLGYALLRPWGEESTLVSQTMAAQFAGGVGGGGSMRGSEGTQIG